MADPRPVLDQINLVVRDVAASVEFYRALGVEIPDTRPGWNEHHRTADDADEAAVDFDIDSAGFARYWGSGDVPSGAMLSFRLGSRAAVDALYAELTEAGHRGLREPYDAFWGARYAILADPEGTAVGLMSEPSSEHRSAPPDVATFE